MDHRQAKAPPRLPERGGVPNGSQLGYVPQTMPPQAPPKEGMSLSPLIYIWLFQTVCNKDIPSFGGAWGGFLQCRLLYHGSIFRLIQGINRSVIRQSIILIVKLMSFKTSVLIWFSRFRGTASPQSNGVGLLCETEEHGSQRHNAIKTYFFNDISFGDMVTFEHRGMVTQGLDGRTYYLMT